jgi:preprotein translocase SecE subunit
MSITTSQEPDNRDEGPVISTPAPATGFFTIYKKGQGYWTRLLTAIVVVCLIGLICQWVFTNSRLWLIEGLTSPERTAEAARSLGRNIALGISGGLALIFAFFAWKTMNSPRGAEFLITTDSEMKRVNWATTKEVVGSTRVVVLFLFFVCMFLFFSDIIFGFFFHFIGVLRTGPFG